LASIAAPPALNAGIWTITGIDVAGIVWTGSTMTIDSQVAQGQGYALTGHFYWRGSGGRYGQENFTGTLDQNNHVTLHSFELVPPTSGIVTNFTYNADVTADGTHIINGTWGGGGIPSNSWSAVQAAPANFDNGTGVLTLPAVVVGSASYTNVLLNLINAANYTFRLAAATAQVPPGAEVITFDAGTGIVTIPLVAVGNLAYSVTLQLTDISTYTFVLATATLIRPN
jgi:hypothetical protein